MPKTDGELFCLSISEPRFLNVDMSVEDCKCTSSIDLRAVGKYQCVGISQTQNLQI